MLVTVTLRYRSPMIDYGFMLLIQDWFRCTIKEPINCLGFGTVLNKHVGLDFWRGTQNKCRFTLIWTCLNVFICVLKLCVVYFPQMKIIPDIPPGHWITWIISWQPSCEHCELDSQKTVSNSIPNLKPYFLRSSTQGYKVRMSSQVCQRV